MGESASERTQRELVDLRAAIDRDVDALMARARDDVDPRNLIRRQPAAVLGSLASLASAVGLGIMRRTRESKHRSQIVDVILERFGGRIDKMKGQARKEFRKQLAKELADVERTGPRQAAYGAISAAVAALLTTMAQGFGRKILGDEAAREDASQR